MFSIAMKAKKMMMTIMRMMNRLNKSRILVKLRKIMMSLKTPLLKRLKRFLHVHCLQSFRATMWN